VSDYQTRCKEYQSRCKDALTTKEGDVWRHLKTGKTVKVHGRVGRFGIALLHGSRKRTVKQDHYLAGDYEQVTTPPLPAANHDNDAPSAA
jgi:hypothetical protein